MTEWVERFAFLTPGWTDLVEIAIVTVLCYRILLILAGTRAIQMLLGLLSLVVMHGVARLFQLQLIEYLLETFLRFGVIAALIVFQPELRNGLAHLGQNRLFRGFTRLQGNQVAEELAEAAEELARNKTGAIIAVERAVGLGEYVQTGTPLHARVSAALLQNIFTPYSLLHDGAAIIRGDEIVAAGSILPLTQSPVPDRSLGTRHRAALGLSEETDALVIVVSEETGTISLAERGRLERGLTPDELRKVIRGIAAERKGE